PLTSVHTAKAGNDTVNSSVAIRNFFIITPRRFQIYGHSDRLVRLKDRGKELPTLPSFLIYRLHHNEYTLHHRTMNRLTVTHDLAVDHFVLGFQFADRAMLHGT